MNRLRYSFLAIPIIAVALLAGCAGMTTAEKKEVAGDVVEGLAILAAGVAEAPGNDALTQYWARYAKGVLLGKSANSTQ